MSHIASSSSGKSATPPVSPPVLRRASAGGESSPQPVPPLFGRTRMGNNNLPDDLAASTIESPPKSIAVRKGKHRKIRSWKLGQYDHIQMPTLSDGGDEVDALNTQQTVKKEFPPPPPPHILNHPAHPNLAAARSTLPPLDIICPSKPLFGNVGVEESSSDIPRVKDEHADHHVSHVYDRKESRRRKKNTRGPNVDASLKSIDSSTLAKESRDAGEKYPAELASDVGGNSNTSSMFSSFKKYISLNSRKRNDYKSSSMATAKEEAASSSDSDRSRNVSSSTLQNSKESKLCYPHCRPPRTPTDSNSRSPQSYEEISEISPLTPEKEVKRKSPSSIIPPFSTKPYLPSISLFEETEYTTKIINLPWSDDASTSGKQLAGKYSGPVNSFLQPHGEGKLVVESCKSLVFYGTWGSGKLVSPLTCERDPIASDGDDFGRGRRKHAANKIDDTSHRMPAGARTGRVSDNGSKVSKKLQKPKSFAQYNIGDACRSPKDMIICRSRHEATESAGLLRKWDGAFIKRSSGIWTYAVLIERSMQPVDIVKRRQDFFHWASAWEVDPHYEMEDSMLFAINGNGGTKIIPKHCWAKFIRRFNRYAGPNLTESRKA